MNKVGLLFAQLHDAETELAAEFRAVAQRQASEPDVYYLGQTLAAQCDQHAKAVRTMARPFGTDLSQPTVPETLHNVMAGVRRKTSELARSRPEAGLLLLRDLRQLYLMAEEANIHWLALGQVAQAIPDQDLLGQVSVLHEQTLTQVKWLKTKIRQACPQVLLVAT